MSQIISAQMAFRIRQRGLTLPLDAEYTVRRVLEIAQRQIDLLAELSTLDKELEELANANRRKGVPNFDGMWEDDLMAWYKKHYNGGRKLAAELFPDKPAGYVKTMKTAACYAINKATAMKCRKEGKITEALKYEQICDDIYGRLPDYAKW
jgi:hypothetical protein